MDIEQLNAEYSLADHLQFVLGNGDFPCIYIHNGRAKALISIYAGQVLSFQPVNEPEDLMFVSDRAYYQAGKAIKGGIPICWPWFGPDPEGLGRASHGFVRNREWQVANTATTAEGDTQVILSLVPTPETTAIWPQSFELMLIITVGSTLTMDLVTRNTGEQTFPLTQALHTYFKIGDIHQVQVLGLEGKDYLDKVEGGAQKTQTGEMTIAGEVDRIYLDAPAELVIHDAAWQRRIRIQAKGSKTAIVWNPWTEIAASMADLVDTDYQRFICVETANAAADVVSVEPGQEVRLQVTYHIERD